VGHKALKDENLLVCWIGALGKTVLWLGINLMKGKKKKLDLAIKTG
jgi:hypothetical protein